MRWRSRRSPACSRSHVVWHLEGLQDPLHDVGLEQPHQVVAQRQVEPALPDRPGAPNGHAAGCRCGETRAVLIRRRTARQDQLPRRDQPWFPPRRHPGAPVELLRTPQSSRARRFRSRAALVGEKLSVSARMMSVPRPAMLVATVTAPLAPANAMIAASCSCCLALRTSCLTPARFSRPDRFRIWQPMRCR